ncbi:MAG: UDP-glucose/GDP-mannose dehydrogenase family protein [Rhodobacteraceae bacterium]|nr:UDP-glucose/GDP-mannose dehydrogenase family protein [Paracoccaceae bacterium]
MKIAMIGAGYVGLVSGVCFSDFGHQVICVEKDQTKLAKLRAGIVPIFEPGLEILLERNIAEGRLEFSDDLATAINDADAIFIAVGTPARRGDGYADLTYVYDTARELGEKLSTDTVIITKSTVPVGTNREIKRIITACNPKAAFEVVSNPEFLREGSAIEDFMRPDRVVVGVESSEAEAVMRNIYRPLNIRETPIVVTDLETAETIKYAANAFLAMKITFINEIANLCEKTGGDVQQVANGIGLDTRIGGKFLHAGPGYGGSCFPKDTLALVQTGERYGAPQRIIETVVAVNDARKSDMVDKIVAACGGSVKGKRIAILGVTFKPNTDDMRDAPSLVIIPGLIATGASITACDPEGGDEARKLLKGVDWVDDAYSAADGADALVIITEWNAFRGLDLGRIRELLTTSVFIDLRNIYPSQEVDAAGLTLTSVGKGIIEG